MNLRLTVKNYKRVEWASEGTDCYTASLYLDGKKIGSASNQGHGGPDDYLFDSPEARKAFDAYAEEWVASVEHDPEYQINGKCYADAESLVSEACAIFRREKDMKKALKGYSLVVRIERPDGWATQILTASLVDPTEADKLIEEERRDGDKIYTYDATSGVRIWTG